MTNLTSANPKVLTSTSDRMSYKRYIVLAMVFFTVVINYMDRSNISVAAFAISDEMELSTVQMGLIFSAFAWTYAVLQVPGGVMVDLVKSRLLYSIILTLWSAATLVQGLVNSLIGLILCRASIGIFEAPSYPINNKIATTWFPEKERASAIAVYTSGQYIGLAFLTPTLVAIQEALGWRGLFIVSGLVGIVWAVVWYMFYRDPKDHKKISQTELDYIVKGGGLINQPKANKQTVKFSWRDFIRAFSYRKLWGVYIGQFCIGSTFIFFLTWFPTYLVKYRGLDFLQSGFLASIPFLAAFVGVLSSGFISDLLIRKGVSKEVARKAPVLSGMLLATTIIGANYTDSTFLVITFLTIAFFGNGFSSITWIFVSSIAPEKLIGLIGGVFNLMGGLSAVVVPIAIGYLVNESDFSPALFFIGALSVLGFLCYTFIVGKVERISFDDEKPEN